MKLYDDCSCSVSRKQLHVMKNIMYCMFDSFCHIDSAEPVGQRPAGTRFSEDSSSGFCAPLSIPISGCLCFRTRDAFFLLRLSWRVVDSDEIRSH